MIERNPKIPKIALPIMGLAGLGVTVVVVLVVVFIIRAWWSLPFNVFGFGDAPDQPIAFLHTMHAGTGPGQLGLDCTFCHRNVAIGEAAGIPPVQQCMFCHSVVGGELTEEEKLLPLEELPQIKRPRAAFERNEPVDWVRVHRVPDHVQFVHEAHIRFFTQEGNLLPSGEQAQVASEVCSTCHGEVAEMEVVRQVRRLKMGDCVNCHRDNDAPTDCTTCHY